MKLKQLFTDDDAVSPVIGVILMVAITVILAAVIATFVLGLGEQVSDTTPNANFQAESPDTSYELSSDASDTAEGEIVQFTHTSGPSIERDNLDIAVSDDSIEDTINEAVDEEITGYDREGEGDYVSVDTELTDREGDEVSASDRVSLDITLTGEVDISEDISEDRTVTIDLDEDVSLTWRSGGDSATLRQFTIGEIDLTIENV